MAPTAERVSNFRESKRTCLKLTPQRFSSFRGANLGIFTRFHMPPEHSIPHTPSWTLSKLQEAGKGKKALAWESENLALPLAIHITLGRSTTLGDCSFLANKMGIRIPATSGWNSCGQMQKGCYRETKPGTYQPVRDRPGSPPPSGLCASSYPPFRPSPRCLPGSPQRLLDPKSSNTVHGTQLSTLFHLKLLFSNLLCQRVQTI